MAPAISAVVEVVAPLRGCPCGQGDPLPSSLQCRFAVSPQVMAIATLAACYNNQQVFRGVVKIRKGQAVTLMMDATNIQAVKAIMYQYVEEVGSAVCF